MRVLGESMKPKAILVWLTATILLTGIVGVYTSHSLNKLLQLSHRSTYSKEEEFRLYDKILEMTSNNEISTTDVIRVIESTKKQRTAAHKVLESAEEISTNMNAILIVLILFQIVLLAYYAKQSNEEK